MGLLRFNKSPKKIYSARVRRNEDAHENISWVHNAFKIIFQIIITMHFLSLFRRWRRYLYFYTFTMAAKFWRIHALNGGDARRECARMRDVNRILENIRAFV